MNNQFQKRRNALLSQLPESSLIILVGYQQKVRSKNIKYHFRQDNDFFYLTGFCEPDAFALLSKDTDGKSRFILFCRPNDTCQEVSFGKRAGIAGAKDIHQADEAFVTEDFYKVLETELDGFEHIFLSDELNRVSADILSLLNKQRLTCAFDVIKQYRTLTSLAKYLHPMRVVKSESELELIRHAVKASTRAHTDVMKLCSSASNEAELSAQFMKSISQFGCTEVAYPNIVAGGNNAMCLHYEDNNAQLKKSQMLLIDAGAEYKMYACDITRSYPINGKFTEAQADIYQLVLSALDAAISKVRPGTPWNSLYETCMEVLCKGLIDLSLLNLEFDEAMQTEAYKKYTVHKTGHWLGMDVHDVGPYHDFDGKWRQLEPNMVFTIEPGIYVPEDCTEAPERYRGIGIRIEDDILVTDDGCENLSKHVPRTIEEIETLMNGQKL